MKLQKKKISFLNLKLKLFSLILTSVFFLFSLESFSQINIEFEGVSSLNENLLKERLSKMKIRNEKTLF